MRNAKTYSGRIESWEVLASSLEARLDTMPFLQPFHDELLSLIAESRAAMLEQEAARAQFHSAVGKRQNLELRGVEMRSRIAAHLKAQLGFRNDQLREFGLNPLPRSTRRRPEEEPQVPPPVEDSANSAKPAEITVAES